MHTLWHAPCNACASRPPSKRSAVCAAPAAAKLTAADVKHVEQLAAQPDVLEVLARSLAPSIYGHHTIKLGLVLQLLGGRCVSAQIKPCFVRCVWACMSYLLVLVAEPACRHSESAACAAVLPGGGRLRPLCYGEASFGHPGRATWQMIRFGIKIRSLHSWKKERVFAIEGCCLHQGAQPGKWHAPARRHQLPHGGRPGCGQEPAAARRHERRAAGGVHHRPRLVRRGLDRRHHA